VLKDEVVEAVAGTFRILAIDRVEEGVEALMGLPSGEIGPEGEYTPGSLYRMVMDRIGELREAVKGHEQGRRRGKRKGGMIALAVVDRTLFTPSGVFPSPEMPFVKPMEELLDRSR